MDRISQLISQYLDGELDDDGVRLLAEALREEPRAVDQLVFDTFIHSQLGQWMNVRQPGDQILTDALGGMRPADCSLDSFEEGIPVEPVLRNRMNASSGWITKRIPRRSWLGMAAALATMLLIAVSIYTANLVTAKHSIVAQLSQADSCQWDKSAIGLPVGSLLHKGQQLKLTSGRALVTFACGAQMMIDGPTTVVLASESKAELTQGRVGAKVPTQAIGFTVSTPAADLVDLGTEFTLTLAADDSCELQVFDGLVELRVLEHDGLTVEQRLRISEGSAVRFDAIRHEISSTPYNEEQRILP